MVALVPAKLKEIFAGVKQAGELGDGASSVEVVYLKALCPSPTANGEELTAGRDAQRPSQLGRRRIGGRRLLIGVCRFDIALRVGCIADERGGTLRLSRDRGNGLQD